MSSLPELASMTGFITTSLNILRGEFPTAYYLMCGLLASREVALFFEGESVSLAFAPDQVHLLAEPRRPAVRLRTTRPAILAVIDAELSLHEAVEIEAITLQGSVDDLALFHDGLLTYVRGAVRCPSFPALLDRFRLAVTPLLHGYNQPDTRQ